MRMACHSISVMLIEREIFKSILNNRFVRNQNHCKIVSIHASSHLKHCLITITKTNYFLFLSFNSLLVLHFPTWLSLLSSGLRGFDTEEELNIYFQSHVKNRDFAVIFDVSGNGNVSNNGTATPGKQFKYTIRTRNNNFRTDQIFWNNVYEVANKGMSLLIRWHINRMWPLTGRCRLLKCIVVSV